MQTSKGLLAILVASTFMVAPALARATSETDDPDFAEPAPDAALQFRPLGSGNACPPDTPVAVWSRDGRLLGYRCVPANPNGA